MADEEGAPAVEVVMVTPALAAEWLERNTHNRTPRVRSVGAYAEDMREDRWLFNGDSIGFSDEGVILDGQQRLMAVVESEVTVPMLVVRGLPAETQETMDAGAKRRFHDVLKLRGETYPELLAAIVRKVNMWERGERAYLTKYVTPSNLSLLDTLEKHPNLRDPIARQASTMHNHVAVPGSILGLGMYVFGLVDQEATDHFFERLGAEEGQRGDPIWELHRATDRITARRGASDQTLITMLMMKAWNAYRDGRRIERLYWHPRERFPEPR